MSYFHQFFRLDGHNDLVANRINFLLTIMSIEWLTVKFKRRIFKHVT